MRKIRAERRIFSFLISLISPLKMACSEVRELVDGIIRLINRVRNFLLHSFTAEKGFVTSL